MKEVKWLWPGKIPRQCLTILEGNPGVSKSTLICDIASRVTTGNCWPTSEVTSRGGCILFNAEDPTESVVLPRLMAAGADLTEIQIVVPSDENDEQSFTIPDHVLALRRAILDQNIKLVVFDPLESFLSGTVDNRNNQQIRKALRSLENLVQEIDCAIILVRHLTKDTKKAAIYRGGGSIGIAGAARAVLLATKDLADPTKCLLLPHKMSWAPDSQGLFYRLEPTDVSDGKLTVNVAKINWTGEQSNLDANDLLAISEEVGTEVSAKDAVEFLREALALGGKLASVIFKEANQNGINRLSVFQAAKLLGCHRDQVGLDFMWILPEVKNESLPCRTNDG